MIEKYPDYSDSGDPWTGAVPSHWKIRRLKYECSILSGQSPHESTYNDQGAGTVLINGPVEYSVEDFGRTRSLKWTSDPKQFCDEGVVLVCLRGSTTGRMNITHCRAAIGRGVAAIRHHFRQAYVNIFVQAMRPFLESIASGATFPSVTSQDLGNIVFPLPPSNEQTQIAKFLDYETAKIDALIEKQQQLIALLKEKRQAVISHAVTKGLNPDAPMRDSGIEWLGEVPAHWEVRAISKCITKITNGFVGPTRGILVPNGVPYVQATHIKHGRVNFDGAYFVRTEWSEARTKSILRAGDVLIVQTGAGTGDVGLVSKDEEGFNCHALIILASRPEVIGGEYLALMLQSKYGQAVLFSIRTGGMHPHLNCGEVKFVQVTVPPLEEQEQIADEVRAANRKYRALEQRARDFMELLWERRTAVISAAVTGKIDVRGWAAPDIDSVEKIT